MRSFKPKQQKSLRKRSKSKRIRRRTLKVEKTKEMKIYEAN